MSVLTLSAAFGDYDRTRPIVDGRVQIDGVNPICQLLSPEEMFSEPFGTRILTSVSFHELLIVSPSGGDNQYIAVPVFLSALSGTPLFIFAPTEVLTRLWILRTDASELRVPTDG